MSWNFEIRHTLKNGRKFLIKVIAIVDGARDLNRQVVKSEHCTVKIPELDFEIPPQTQKGSLTTVEGLIQKAADGLRHTAELNAETNPEWAEAVQAFCAEKLEPIVKRKFQVPKMPNPKIHYHNA